jgi:hypothetical protein
MLSEFPIGFERIGQLARWNPYVSNWPIVLAALRRLWETGKVSELKSPFYEPLKKPENQ